MYIYGTPLYIYGTPEALGTLLCCSRIDMIEGDVGFNYSFIGLST